MTDERALLRTIAHEPDEDDARRVYADWLDDHGRADRAEFIRAQVRFGEIIQSIRPADSKEPSVDDADSCGDSRAAEDTPERRELAYRCRRLLDRHEETWLAPLRGVIRH